MLNYIKSIDWDKYKQDARYLDMQTALLNLNSDEKVKRTQSLAHLEDSIEFSMEMHNTLVFDLVHILFEILNLDEFRYKNYATQILSLCGKYAETKVTDIRNIKQGDQLKRVICEELTKYSSANKKDLDSDSRSYLAYLESICQNR